ncbi:HTH-type transcriptional repressor KstR2 [Ruminiclostridium hungatei]|uniref:HTH-type transcriptional repressor KstR2 n=1 Tax=Ruminiclostridium hungatei TaxID=48256 RepID=A0A1V4SGB2_RUMHU|nr:TetR/AcrR family transcriptional regulator [Ruminiclostridium hungatei]OPX42972.1 HTH-type transcriptional repressor KstR2 [Ruminiclostridium hungatei]
MARNKYPEETQAKILEAAMRLFLKKGYEQTTIQDIVSELGGLTKGAFYHHFKSKEEVMDALTTKLFYDDNPFEKVKRQKDLTGLEKIKSMFLQSLDDNSDHRQISIEAMQLLGSPNFLKVLIDDNRDTVAPMYQELIEEGIRDGSIKSEQAKLLAQVFVLLTNFWMIPTIYPGTAEESWQRLLFVKEITDKMGMPVLDDHIIELCRQSLPE